MSSNPVFARDGGWCAYQVPGVCLGAATDGDHRINRSQGGHDRPSNKVSACRGCHVYKTEHPYEARGYGWSLSAGTDTERARVFLRHRVYGEHWYLLNDHGGLNITTESWV